MKIVFADALQEHINSIFEIESESFSCPWSKQSFIDAFSNQSMKIIVALDEKNNVCAFSVVLMLGYEGEVLDIAVSPRYRKLGIGNALLNHSIDIFKGYGVSSVFLEVRESNLAARNLYLNNGFSQIGIRKNYYTNPTENAIIMLKEINQNI